MELQEAVPMELQEAVPMELQEAVPMELQEAVPMERQEELRAQRQEHSDVDEQLQEELMIGASEGDFATLRTRAAENECKIQGTEKMLTECVARREVALARGIAAKQSEKDALKVCMKADDSRMNGAKASTSKRAAHCENLQTNVKKKKGNIHPTATSTATSYIVAGCTGTMPNLPKKVAAGVRALADWIVQNAGGVPAVPLTELYDETIGWILGAQHGPTGPTGPRVPLAARSVDMIPEGHALNSARALLRHGVRKEILKHFAGLESHLLLAWQAATDGSDEVATIDTHKQDLRRIKRAIRVCDEIDGEQASPEQMLLLQSPEVHEPRPSSSSRPSRISRLLRFLPRRMLVDVAGLSSELRTRLQVKHDLLRAIPSEHTNVWERVLDLLHAHDCTIGTLRALADSPNVPMLDGCSIETPLQPASISTARLLNRADVRRDLQQLAMHVDSNAAPEPLRHAHARLDAAWSATAALDAAPTPSRPLSRPQIEHGSVPHNSSFRLELPRLTVAGVQDRAGKRPKATLAVYINDAWLEGRARAFRHDGGVEVEYDGKESVAKRGHLPVGIEVGGDEVSCNTKRKSKLVAVRLEDHWREGKLVQCSGSSQQQPKERIVVKFHGSDMLRTVQSARWIEYLVIPAESVANDDVAEIPEEKRPGTRDLVRAGRHGALGVSEDIYKLVVTLDTSVLDGERDRAMTVAAAQELAPEQLYDARKFVRLLEKTINDLRTLMAVPRATPGAVVTRSRMPAGITDAQRADTRTVLDYADDETADMRAILGERVDALEAVWDERKPGADAQRRASKLRAIAESDDLRVRTERLSRLLEQCFQRFWDFVFGFEHDMPTRADIQRLRMSGMPPEPKAAARRLLRQQGSILDAMARVMRVVRIGNGPRASVRETATERVRREETEAALDEITKHREARERKAQAELEAKIPPGEVDASEHPPATVDEVRSFAALHHDDYSGALVSVRFDLESDGEAWYGGEVDSLNPDGSLEVWYPLEEKLEGVPVSEVADGNVRWSRWTAHMVRRALPGAELPKVSSMIRRSFEKKDPVRAALIADYKKEADRRNAVVDLTADDARNTEPRARPNTDPRDIIFLDSDEEEAQMLASALIKLRKKAGNNNARVASRLAVLRARIERLPDGAMRDELESRSSAVEARNGARDERDVHNANDGLVHGSS
jgi:hypothetical protein